MAASKTSESNADIAFKKITDFLDIESWSRHGGGTTDNANDAKKESAVTFEKIMNELHQLGYND